MGKDIIGDVWKQFGNQIGIDMTNETLIHQYDREHTETYKGVVQKIMQDERYKLAIDEIGD